MPSGVNAEEKNSVPGSPVSPPREDGCAEILGENYISGLDGSLPKALTLPRHTLPKEENTLRAAVIVNPPANSLPAEGALTSMFPKETEMHLSESLPEPRERGESAPLKSSKKLPENHLPRNSPPFQPELPEISRKDNGNLFLSFFFFFLIFWPYYSSLCTQESLLVVLRGAYGVPGN